MSFLADDVEFYSTNQSTHAKGNVKFQDTSYLITGETFTANKQNDGLEAVIDNANYQELESNANGSAAIITKTANKVIFRDATYSFCPINQNDWQIRAKTIEANLEKIEVLQIMQQLFFRVSLFFIFLKL